MIPRLLLSIVIPTFSRYQELGRCLDSLVRELDTLEKKELSNIEVLIGDNCSPQSPLDLIIKKNINVNLIFIGRKSNIGLVCNVLDITQKASGEYVLWLTDDDLLVPGALRYILDKLNSIDKDIGFMWCALPTFDARTGEIFTVASESFSDTTFLEASRVNASLFAQVGWALTRQIYKKNAIDFEGVRKIDNAYFPIYLASQAMMNFSSAYFDFPYVLHSYHNQEHWEEWGIDELTRKLRIFCDALTIMDISIKPQVFEIDIVKNLWNYRQKEISDNFRSDMFKTILKSRGVDSILRDIRANLGTYGYIYPEITNHLQILLARADRL
jgi:glycosyltransferase involved in cell wall biosynthesis